MEKERRPPPPRLADLHVRAALGVRRQNAKCKMQNENDECRPPNAFWQGGGMRKRYMRNAECPMHFAFIILHLSCVSVRVSGEAKQRAAERRVERSQPQTLEPQDTGEERVDRRRRDRDLVLRVLLVFQSSAALKRAR